MSSKRTTRHESGHNDVIYELITCSELGQLLKKIGYSHREFAEFIGRSRSYVSSVINSRGDPPLRMIWALHQMVTMPWYKVALQAVREDERIRIEDEELRRAEWAEDERHEEEERQQKAERRRQQRKALKH